MFYLLFLFERSHQFFFSPTLLFSRLCLLFTESLTLFFATIMFWCYTYTHKKSLANEFSKKKKLSKNQISQCPLKYLPFWCSYCKTIFLFVVPHYPEVLSVSLLKFGNTGNYHPEGALWKREWRVLSQLRAYVQISELCSCYWWYVWGCCFVSCPKSQLFCWPLHLCSVCASVCYDNILQ